MEGGFRQRDWRGLGKKEAKGWEARPRTWGHKRRGTGTVFVGGLSARSGSISKGGVGHKTGVESAYPKKK